MNNTDRPQTPPGATEERDLLPALLEFFKALAQPARLRVAGAIAGEALTAREVGERTGLGLRAALGHLGTLVEAGLATVEGEGSGAHYRLAEARLHALSAELLDSPRARALAGARDERSRVLAAFFRDGRLLKLPTGDKRRLIVLEEIATRFESGRTYTEREINEMLKTFHEDYTSIRRWLVDYVFLNRHEGVYWVGERRRRAAEEGAGGDARLRWHTGPSQ